MKQMILGTTGSTSNLTGQCVDRPISDDQFHAHKGKLKSKHLAQLSLLWHCYGWNMDGQLPAHLASVTITQTKKFTNFSHMGVIVLKIAR